jgi:hypothetical protein
LDKEIKWAVGIIIVVEIVFWILVLFFASATGPGLVFFTQGFTNLLNNAFFEVILFMGLLPVYTLVLALIAASLSGGFFRLLKAVLGTRGTYVYAKVRVERQVSFRHYYIKSLFPALMAMTISLTLMDFNRLFGFFFNSSITEVSLMASGSFMFLMSFLAVPFCALLFLVFWALNDSGLFITTKTRKGNTELVMGKFGDHFLKYLEGFTGLMVFVTYAILLLKYSMEGYLTLQFIPMISFGIAMPFILAMFVFPATVLCERRMFNGHHSLKPTLSRLTDITDEIDDLEQKYHERLGKLEH